MRESDFHVYGCLIFILLLLIFFQIEKKNTDKESD